MDSKYNWKRLKTCGVTPLPRSSAAIFKYYRKLYIFGGKLERTGLNDLHSLDLDGYNWEECVTSGDLPPKDMHFGCIYGDSLYVFPYQRHSLDVHCLDIKQMKWTKLTCTGDIPSPRHSMPITIVDNTVYMFGGGLGNNHFDDFYSFTLPKKQSIIEHWISSLWEQKKEADSKIIVEGKEIQCHKCIISQSNELMMDIQQGNQHLKNVKYETMNLLLESLYGRSLDWKSMDISTILDIIITARRYSLRNLEHIALSQCEKKITHENFITTLSLAQKQRIETLKMMCFNFFLANKQEILDKQDIKQLDVELMVELMKLEGEPSALQFPTKQNCLQSHLWNLFTTKKYADATLVSNDGKKFPVHKAILMTACEYFDKMMGGSFTESKQKEISLDLSGELLELVIRFIYTGTINPPNEFDKLLELYQFAEMIVMKELIDEIFNQKIECITKETVLTCLKHCIVAGAEGKLRERCYTIVKSMNPIRALGEVLETQVNQETLAEERFKKQQKQIEENNMRISELESKLSKVLQLLSNQK